MDKHLEIKLKCVGDKITAISQAHDLVKAHGDDLYLNFEREGFKIRVSVESYVQDLITIYRLRSKLADKEE